MYWVKSVTVSKDNSLNFFFFRGLSVRIKTNLFILFRSLLYVSGAVMMGRLTFIVSRVRSDLKRNSKVPRIGNYSSAAVVRTA